jgi:two-component system, chemotaxis family, chemotaxis protein CheY
MHALIVDDSRATRRLIARMLSAMGFDFTEAENGQDALDRLQHIDTPDVALVDWNMPEMDGLTLIKLLRSERNYDRMPVLMVTSETEPASIVRALAAGADEYTMKPFTADAIAEKLRMVGVLA